MPWIIPHTSWHSLEVEMVRGGHPAVPDGAGDMRDGALLNPQAGGASGGHSPLPSFEYQTESTHHLHSSVSLTFIILNFFSHFLLVPTLTSKAVIFQAA